MSLPWSPQQREWLQALGHPLLVLAPGSSVTTGANAGLQAAPPLGQAEPVLTSTSGAETPDAALHRALLKATGLPAIEAARALEAFVVDASALRGDPMAKRLLWTRLRGLRRGRPT